jgi:hypothetical protein
VTTVSGFFSSSARTATKGVVTSEKQGEGASEAGKHGSEKRELVGGGAGGFSPSVFGPRQRALEGIFKGGEGLLDAAAGFEFGAGVVGELELSAGEIEAGGLAGGLLREDGLGLLRRDWRASP